MKKLVAVAFATFAILTASNAQEAQSTSEPGVVSVAPKQEQPKPDYIQSVHKDWAIRCSPAQGNQCFMQQTVVGKDGNKLLEFTLVKTKDEQDPSIVMGATIATPFNVLLPRKLYVQVDEKLPDDPYDYTFCNQFGCFVRYPLTQELVDTYKKAGKMTIVLFHLSNPQQGLEIPISLQGFTDAYNTLMKIESGELSAEPVEAAEPAKE